jgi:hypothetical protein
MSRKVSDTSRDSLRDSVVGEDEVPAVEAVLAPVRDEVAGQPHPVLARRGEQEGAPATVDAGDLLLGLQHGTQYAVAGRPVA